MEIIKNWYEIYSHIADLLDKFYVDNNELPSKRIYAKLENSKYGENNPASLFEKEFTLSEKGLDPIQIFSSFSYTVKSPHNRIRAINDLLEVFDSDKRADNNLSFTGCPTPIITKIIQYRGWKIQNEIWKVFHEIKKDGISGLNNDHFKSIENWFGIDVVSFTMFLYWINSEQFLPLDRNTIKFLIASKIIINRPRSYKEYYDLCTEKTLFLMHGNKERKEVFRTIVFDAYKFSDKEYMGNILSGSTATIITSHTNEPKSIEELEKEAKRRKVDLKRNFKIIAIRPLIKEHRRDENDKQKHLKNLVEGKLYQFYHEYIFNKNDDKVIQYEESKGISIFNHESKDDNERMNISISAIVGKNGSGKSAIVELIYLVINKLAHSKEIETTDDLIDEEIFADLYVKSDHLYKISVGRKVSLNSYDLNSNGDEYSINELDIFRDFDIESFCYSIVVNYSLYSLNSKIIGEWINPLFHKNDSYQVPIVLNPWRDDGSIDVNNEEDLTKSRLLSNILEPERINFDKKIIPELVPNAIPVTLEIKLDYEKMDRKRKIYKEKYKKNINQTHIDKIIGSLGIDDIVSNKYIQECKEYIFLKLHSIAETYPNKYGDYKELTSWVSDTQRVKEYYNALINDDSHITFKLRQAVNYLKYKIYNPDNDNNIIDIAAKIKQNKTENVISNKQNTLLNKKRLRTIDLVPPSFFKSNIFFKHGGNFSQLSSGEKQEIFSINSITYQLFNINSVMYSANTSKYSCVNIIFDEVELYFHPDMQRSYINKLRDSIILLKLDDVKNINMIFVTHSPFILSDIPANNLLLLEQKSGKSFPKHNKKETFGANVHDLLADEFFMNEGFMGEFAKRKVKSLVTHLHKCIEQKRSVNSNGWNEESIKNFINIIGEPLIRDSINDMFDEVRLSK